MANLRTDFPLSRRIARSFLHFLNSVEPSPGVDGEAILVAKECLAEAFKIDQASLDTLSGFDSLVDIFTAREAIAGHDERVSDAPSSSSGKSPQSMEAQDSTRELHLPGQDELFGQFFSALETVHYFRRMPDGSDDQFQLDRAINLFHKAVKEMQIAGRQTLEKKALAETFKSQGNKAMQSKLYGDAIELYTFAIALCEDSAIYFCNRAAAYTQIHRYAEAVQDCQKSIEINPNYSKAYSRLGFAYYAQGKYRDAIDKGFMKALQLDPNNESVKENIRVAEKKLKEEQRREATGQGSASTGHGQTHQSGGGGAAMPPFASMPFNANGLPIQIPDLLMNMGGGVTFPEPLIQNRHWGQNGTSSHNDPGVTMGGGINYNVNELPPEISGALRSMMGMFSESGGGAAPAPSHGHQPDEGNQRPDAAN